MKVILLRDIKGLGAAGEVKEVAEGYGRNFLVPRKMAIIANRGMVAEAEKVKAAQGRREVRQRQEAEALKARVESMQVIVKVRVGEEGKLFGSVTNADIAEALKEQHDFEIDKRKVDLTEPIKETGESTVRLELDSNVDANLKVIVTEL